MNFCPGENSAVFCGSAGKCDDGSKCYSDITPGKQQCCSNLTEFCKATQMITYFNGNKNVYNHKWSNSISSLLYYRDPITFAACPNPYSYTFFNFLKMEPIGFTPTESSPAKQCAKNSDCDRSQFCGPAVNPHKGEAEIDASNDGKPRTFCYKKPALPSPFALLPDPNEIGIRLCNSHKQCTDDEMCHITEEWTGKLRMDNGLLVNGICVRAMICESEHVTLHARRLNSGFCGEDKDCKEISEFVSNEFSPSCISFGDKKPAQKLCCFKKRKKCSPRGYQNLPSKTCSRTSDCNSNTSPWTNWCDANGECCSEDGENWASPDGVTPLYNEPVCVDVVEGDATSGKCPTDPNASCLNGHCHQSGKMEDGVFTPGEHNYQTQFPCDPATPIPDEFTYSLCNPTTKTILKLGSKEIEKVNNEKSCEKDEDCSSDGSQLCINKGSGNRGCSPKLPSATSTTSEPETDNAPVETESETYLGWIIGLSVTSLVLLAIAAGVISYFLWHFAKTYFFGFAFNVPPAILNPTIPLYAITHQQHILYAMDFLKDLRFLDKLAKWLDIRVPEANLNLMTRFVKRIGDYINDALDTTARIVDSLLLRGRCRNPHIQLVSATQVVLPNPDWFVHQNFFNFHLNNKLGRFFMSEGPSSTINQHMNFFLESIFHNNIVCVFMLTRFFEAKLEKCAHYFPDQPGQSINTGVYIVTCNTEERGFLSPIASRVLTITRIADSKQHIFRHIHDTTWQDHSRPADFLTILEMILISISFLARGGNVLVHCSAGIGRTGTFAAILMAVISIATDVANLTVESILIRVREIRAGAVQNSEQLLYIVGYLLSFLYYILGSASGNECDMFFERCEAYLLHQLIRRHEEHPRA